MTNLVTGGAGFIGSHLVRLLVERGEQVRVLERPGAAIDHLPAVDVVRADIRDRAAVRRAVAGCDIVYHLAADPQLWRRRRGEFVQVNFRGTVNVLHAALEAGARRVLHCSTESILTRAGQTVAIAEDQDVPYADVVGPYCQSKWRAERHAFALARAGHPVLVVNPTLPVGPGDGGRSPPTQMILDCARGQRSAYLDADLNLIDARDVALGMVRAVERGMPGRRYLLGSENWTIRELFGHIAAATGQPPPRWKVPYALALGVAYASEFVADTLTGRMPAASVTGVKLTQRAMRFDPRRSLEALGLEPRPVRDSLAEALGWMRGRGWL